MILLIKVTPPKFKIGYFWAKLANYHPQQCSTWIGTTAKIDAGMLPEA